MFYKRTTNESGVARLNINLNPDTYIVTAINPVNNEMYSNTILVIMSPTVINGSDMIILSNTTKNFTVVLKDASGNPISSKIVDFTFKGKTISVSTDKNGMATFVPDSSVIGKYKVQYSFAGDVGYKKSNSSNIINIVESTVILSANDFSKYYGENKPFKVTLTDLQGNPLVNKSILFTIYGVSYNRTADSNGVASLNINLNPGNYTITYSYSTPDKEDYNYGSNAVVINKQMATVDAKDLIMLPHDGSAFKALVTDKNGNVLKGVNVIFKVYGISYTRATNAEGIASLNINLGVGYYNVSYLIDSLLYQSKEQTKHILVNGTMFIAKDIAAIPNSTSSFTVKLVNAYGKPMVNQAIRFILNGVTYTNSTDANGIATLNFALSSGNHPVSYFFDGSGGYANNSGMNYIHVNSKVSLANIITAANTVKNYIANNYKLPDSINIGGTEYSMAQFLYLLSVATVNLNNGNSSDILAMEVLDPKDKYSSGTLSNLYNYVSVAENLISYISNNGVAPNFASSDVGKIGYDELVYAFSRVVAFYGNNNNILPAYVAIKSVATDSSGSVLNSKNTITDLTPYLSASANCQVNDTAIQELASSLTSGLTNDLAKATAIYNYVRDAISYSSYYNTRFGAVGTLNRKTGNCVDQTHLVISLFRASGIAARYVHGKCVFSSGSIGHVWAQVLIGDTWVVADTTSSRNSLGVVNNWNNYNYALHGYYASLSF